MNLSPYLEIDFYIIMYNFFITATITTTTSTAASTTITLLSLNQGRPEGTGGGGRQTGLLILGPGVEVAQNCEVRYRSNLFIRLWTF